ncbi:MAG: ATP synthase subunit I [Wenzhouxiangella sp.]|jgi:ATP synthase protein I|nr:ATP synthase subunit I [Wenzhouxiangella sp.]
MAEPDAGQAVLAKTIAWLLRVQAILTVGVALVFGLLSGLPMAIAAMAGGFIGLLLTAVTGLRVALSAGGDAKTMVRVFYRAMALKFVLAVILFIVVAKWFAGFFVPVIVGYCATLVANWLAMRKLSAIE